MELLLLDINILYRKGNDNMGLRYKKSFKIVPGVRINLGKKSAGISFGGKGCRYSINTKGRKTTTIGIPGTGLSYSMSSSAKSSSRNKRVYNSTSYSNKERIQNQLNNEKSTENERNKLLVEEYETHVDLIKNVHRECKESVDWIKISKSNPPFIIGETGPFEKEALNNFENFKPNIIEKIFQNNGEKRKEKLRNSILEAKEKDIESYREWEEKVHLAIKILAGDIESYYTAIEQSDPFDDLVSFGSGFEFGTDNQEYIEIEFIVKSTSVVPEKSRTLTKTGKLSEKSLSKTSYYDITQDYVCSCSIRLARELFALLPVNYVIVHACDDVLNTATGNNEISTILSVKFTRDKFNDINFDRIDASDFVETFDCNMIFKKTSGFRPVERLN